MNIKDRNYNSHKLTEKEDKNIMRRSNPVACFQGGKPEKNSSKEPNSKTAQNESIISESSNTHLSKSEVNFHKKNQQK